VIEAHVVESATREVDGVVRVVVTARPKSTPEGVSAGKDGALVVRVRTPPVDGAANARILEVFAEALGVPKRSVELVRGETARHKELAVRELSLVDVRARLQNL
jgi:hypothetical protein